MVNVTGNPRTIAMDIAGAESISDTATIEIAAGKSLADDNILGREEAVTIKKEEVKGIGKQFNYTLPEYCAAVMRIKTKPAA